MTAEDIVVRMKSIQANDIDDPLCNLSSESELDQQPGTSYKTRSLDKEIFGQSFDESSAEEVESAVDDIIDNSGKQPAMKELKKGKKEQEASQEIKKREKSKVSDQKS